MSPAERIAAEARVLKGLAAKLGTVTDDKLAAIIAILDGAPGRVVFLRQISPQRREWARLDRIEAEARWSAEWAEVEKRIDAMNAEMWDRLVPPGPTP